MLALVAAAAVLFGWPSLHGEFLQGDDLNLLRDHFLINHPSALHALQIMTMVHGDLYQPLPMLTFMANYAVGGENTWGYHLVNIAVHAINAMLAALLAWRISRRALVGFLAGAMFACHAFAMEPVAWISGRIILLAATFALVMLLLFALRDESPGAAWSAGSCVAWALSLISKVLPSVPLAAVWCDVHLYPRRTRTRTWYVTLALLLLETGIATAAAYWSTRKLGYFHMMQAESTTSFPARVMLASRYYFENYVWPTRLSAWSPPPTAVPMLSVPVAIGAAEWLAVLAIMAWSWKRCRTASVGVGLFVLLLLPFVAAMSARTFLTSDRYMYLPILGLHLAVAAWAARAIDALASRFGRSASWVGVAAAGVVLLFWGRQGWHVAGVFHDNISQADRTVALYPNDVRAWTEMVRTHVKEAEDLKRRGLPEQAIKMSKEAVRIALQQRAKRLDDAGMRAEIGEAYWQLGEYTKAVEELQSASAELSRNNQARYYLGLSLAKLGRADEARAIWHDILKDKDQFLPAATALARSYRDAGRIDDAMHWFRRALELNQYHRDALSELALLHMARGEASAAEPLLRRVLDVSPADYQARVNLAAVRSQQGDAGEALAIYDGLVRDYPDDVQVRFSRAQLLAAMRRMTEAEAEYRRIILRDPPLRAAVIALHQLMQAGGRHAELVAMWQSLRVSAAALPDAPAWLAFSHALAGEEAAARALIADVRGDDPGALLAGWVQVWLELTAAAVDPAELLRAIDQAAPRETRSAADAEQLQAAVMAMSDWSRLHPDDPGACYCLARALLAQGQPDAARRFAERARDLARGGIWAERAGQLLRDRGWESGS